MRKATDPAPLGMPCMQAVERWLDKGWSPWRIGVGTLGLVSLGVTVYGYNHRSPKLLSSCCAELRILLSSPLASIANMVPSHHEQYETVPSLGVARTGAGRAVHRLGERGHQRRVQIDGDQPAARAWRGASGSGGRRRRGGGEPAAPNTKATPARVQEKINSAISP